MTKHRIYIMAAATFLLGMLCSTLITLSIVRTSTASAAANLTTQGIACPGCVFSSAQGRLAGNNFNGAYLDFACFGDRNSSEPGTPPQPGADLTGATFKNASLIGTDFSNTILNNASFRNAIVTGPGAFEGGCRGPSFQGNAIFVGAVGSNVDFVGIQTLPNTYGNPPSIDVTGAKFPGANFKGDSVDLNASCPDPNVYSCSGTDPTDLSGANFTNAQLHTSGVPNVNFSGANFTGASLRDSIPAAAILTGDNFTNANFTGADTESTIGLDTATLAGVIWSNTICPDGTNSNSDGGTCLNNLTTDGTNM